MADRMGTTAEGLATRVGFELPQEILREHLDEFMLVSENDLRDATVLMIGGTSNLVEPAAASTLAAAMKLRDWLAGKRVALIQSGANISLDQLRELVTGRREVHVVLRRAGPRAAPAPADRPERRDDRRRHHPGPHARAVEVRERGLVARHAAADVGVLDRVQVDRLAVGVLRPVCRCRSSAGARRRHGLAALERRGDVAVGRPAAPGRRRRRAAMWRIGKRSA